MSNIKLFQTQQVRTHWDEIEEKWYFAIVDVIEILAESVKPRDYWYRLKKREKGNGIELSTNCRQLKMMAKDGKMRDTEIADTETLLRIIQSIPSPKAEPFKRWLAKVGYERLEEIENPELALKRTKEANEYRLKTYLGHENSEEKLRELLSAKWTDLATQYCDENGVNVLVAHFFMMLEGGEMYIESEELRLPYTQKLISKN